VLPILDVPPIEALHHTPTATKEAKKGRETAMITMTVLAETLADSKSTTKTNIPPLPEDNLEVLTET